MTITGAEALVKALEMQGVKVVFGYPGGAILPVYRALKDSSIEHILPRSEQAAAHAASGYARTNHTVGVCMATSGPGATNLVTGIATAYMDSIPMVAITGQVSTAMVGTDAFQEVDTKGITLPITKHNYLITNTDDIPRIVKEAFHIAKTGRPGPVVIDIPKNIAEAPCKAKLDPPLDLPGYKPTYKGHPSQIKNAVNLIEQAKRPVLYIGGGIINAQAEPLLVQFAEKQQIPVVSTLMGIGVMDANHPLYLGMLGLHGWPAANMAVNNCDLLLCMGARFDDRATGSVPGFAPNATVVHIDIDPAEIGKNAPSQVPIVGDIHMILTELLHKMEACDRSGWLKELEPYRAMRDKVYPQDEDPNKLTARAVMQAISRITEGKAIMTTDVGQHQMTAAQFYEIQKPGRFISSGGLGTMGYGLSAAVGAQMAAPNDLVICITGDGSFQMNMAELATAKEQRLPIKVILFNNNCLALVRQLQDTYCDAEYYGVFMPGNPDFIQLAKAYDMATYRLTENKNMEETLREALSNDKLTLVECVISEEDMIFPYIRNGESINQMVMAEEEMKNRAKRKK